MSNFAAIALMWGTLLLIPIGRTAELPVLLGALLAVVLLIRAPGRQHLVLVGAFAVAYCLPALISAIDAVDPEKSWTTALGSLRFVLFAAAVVLLLGGRTRTQDTLRLLVAALVGLWAVDALIQGATGLSLGGPLSADRVSGVFGADNLKLGPVLAVLSPFVLLQVAQRFGSRIMALAFALLAIAVMLAGSRAGWVMLAVVAMVLLWVHTRRVGRFVSLLAAMLVIVIALGALVQQVNREFALRVERTVMALRGDPVALDFALAGRVPIWCTAARMTLSHPINGVGVRGFRDAYPAHAGADDPWVNASSVQGAMHPHQLLLEVASETGAVGLLLWGFGVWIALRAWRRAADAARARALAPGLALLAMTFPLNTHFAFYSSFWGLLFWWLLAFYAAALVPADGEDR